MSGVDYDLVIVGCGAAGTASALAAAERAKEENENLTIAILERAPFEQRWKYTLDGCLYAYGKYR